MWLHNKWSHLLIIHISQMYVCIIWVCVCGQVLCGWSRVSFHDKLSWHHDDTKHFLYRLMFFQERRLSGALVCVCVCVCVRVCLCVHRCTEKRYRFSLQTTSHLRYVFSVWNPTLPSRLYCMRCEGPAFGRTRQGDFSNAGPLLRLKLTNLGTQT